MAYIVFRLSLFVRSVLAGAGMGIDWLMDTRMAKAPLLWVGLLCFSLATFLGTLVHIARLKALKTLRCETSLTKH